MLLNHPAQIIGYNGGAITPGKPADLTVCSLDEWTIDRNAFVSKGHNTPFHGRRVFGRVLRTFVNGRQVYQNPDLDMMF